MSTSFAPRAVPRHVESLRAALPTVSIIMPVRNERAHIVASVESALASDYAAERIELMVVDGMSDDGTRDLLAAMAADDSRVHLLDNAERGQAAALNKGIAAAHGYVVVRMDAHTIYPGDYLRRCVDRLVTSGADNVGGVCETVPGADTPSGRAIAVALSHAFGVGNSRFRVGATTPMSVDTVPFGCWRRSTLLDLGGFATDLPHAEDDELNARLIRRGGRVLLDPAISARYVARSSLRRLALMLYQYGYSKPFAARRIGRVTTARQLAPPALVAALAAGCLAALLWPAAMVFVGGIVLAHLVVGSLMAARKARAIGVRAAALLPPTFLVMHLAYGWGYLRGAADLYLHGTPRQPRRLSR